LSAFPNANFHKPLVELEHMCYNPVVTTHRSIFSWSPAVILEEHIQKKDDADGFPASSFF
jgi:hypothetical protein